LLDLHYGQLAEEALVLTRKYLRGLGLSLLCISSMAWTQTAQDTHGPSVSALRNLPETHSPVFFSAVNDPITGQSAFSFQGEEIPPVIRAFPGETIDITYHNAMSAKSHEQCIDGPCMNMTNLHFHGLHVSPEAPQDDVLTMMATPGETLHYRVDIPAYHVPGLYWYHTHPHGESYQQDLDGMSGAIVIEGMERYIPELRGMRERILILRDQRIIPGDARSATFENQVDMSQTPCSVVHEAPERLFTVNGSLRPQIKIAPGERQFWRMVNASPDLYADLRIDGEKFQVVALDGMPLAYHDPRHPIKSVNHILVPPAGRMEAIVTGPQAGSHASLRTMCFDTGSDGDPNPSMVLADLLPQKDQSAIGLSTSHTLPSPAYKVLSRNTLKRMESAKPDFTVAFTEDKKGFYINDHRYSPQDGPMTTVTLGRYLHWKVVNNTHEVHPFHIHQVHFLVYAQNGQPLPQGEWLDTVNVSPEGSVDLIMDFTDRSIKGMSLFHCHLLSHEDKGMMAKILFK
jgi:suppressor of ftsI